MLTLLHLTLVGLSQTIISLKQNYSSKLREVKTAKVQKSATLEPINLQVANSKNLSSQRLAVKTTSRIAKQLNLTKFSTYR